MLLIDDDQAEILERQEQRRAGAGHDAHLARHVACRQTFSRMRGARSECHSAGFAPKRSWKRSRKLAVSAISGKQDQHLLALLQRLGDRLEIDLRLAGAGDTVDQRHRKSACVGRFRADPAPPASAVPSSRGLGKIRIRQRNDRRRRQEHRLENALCISPSMTLDETPAACARPTARPGKPVGGSVEHPRAGRRHPLRSPPTKPQPLDHRFRLEGGRRPQRHARDKPGRRKRIGRHPVDEIAHLLVERRAVEDMRDRPKLLRIDAAVVTAVPDDADHLTRPERHLDDRAGLDRHAFRHRIGIGLRRRHRHQNRHGADHGRGFEKRAKEIGRICAHCARPCPQIAGIGTAKTECRVPGHRDDLNGGGQNCASPGKAVATAGSGFTCLRIALPQPDIAAASRGSGGSTAFFSAIE